MPAEFLGNLPKNLTTHLTHKLYSVFPKQKSPQTMDCEEQCDYFIVIHTKICSYS